MGDRPRLNASLTAMRWSVAVLTVAAAYAGIAWVAFNWHATEAASSEPPPALTIDLAPLAAAPPTQPQDVAPGPQETEADPDPADTPTPVEEAKAEPMDAPTPVDQPTSDPTPPDPVTMPEIKLTDLPRIDDAVAVLTPMPKPPPQHKETSTTRETKRKKNVRRDIKRIRQTTAMPTSEARRSDNAAAPSTGASTQATVSPASWKGELMGRLNRYKRYPAGASSFGTTTIAFTINRSGQVLSSRLIGSSGDHALDEEAVSLPRRASPLPPPPPNVGGGVITLTVPIRFNR